ncbi:MAG: hypothetical protein ACK50P_17180 [Planctomycetaceae bacterium]
MNSPLAEAVSAEPLETGKKLEGNRAEAVRKNGTGFLEPPPVELRIKEKRINAWSWLDAGIVPAGD